MPRRQVGPKTPSAPADPDEDDQPYDPSGRTALAEYLADPEAFLDERAVFLAGIRAGTALGYDHRVTPTLEAVQECRELMRTSLEALAARISTTRRRTRRRRRR